ncbi:ABC transporter-like, ATP-binding domain [Dillenia turbinata]|uniref:ABC-type xenobiotic transporter n=1 Tax=Dillenia turbinata TaxID=194707 RepID=A0AAN8YW74_9MAGN
MGTLNMSLGKFSWLCEGEFSLGSSCIQTTIIDVTNLLFLSVFYTFLLVGSVRKQYSRENARRDLVSSILSVCCAIISIGYVTAGFQDIIVKNAEFSQLGWLIHFIRGFIWISLAISVLVQKSKCVKILVSIWWVWFFALVSVVNVKILFTTHSLDVLEIVPWPVNFLLLVCAFRSLFQLISQHSRLDKTLYKPLLVDTSEKNQSRLQKSSFFSKLTFSWINPLLHLGNVKILVVEDIPSLELEDEADLAYQNFARTWNELRDKSPNYSKNLVFWALARIYVKENLIVGIYAFLRTIAVVASPLLLYAFVQYSNNDEENVHEGLAIVGCLVVAKVVESFTQRHWFFNSRRSGMKMRSALMVAVYRKQLMLSNLGRRRHSTGEIVNYIAVDAYRMGEFPWWFHTTWSAALQLFLGVGALFAVVGLGALPGLVPLITCGILNVPIARVLKNCQTQLMVAQDERLRATSEILNSMKIIKLQSWEDKFKGLIDSLRDNEFKRLAEVQYQKTFGTLIYWMCPTIISSVIFTGCAFFSTAPLNAGTIFTILAALRCLAEPVRMIPEALSVLIQVKVSFDRLNSFLLGDELKSKEIRMLQIPGTDSKVRIQGGNFSWDQESTILALRDIDLDVKKGQKIAVCGPVGAGKSSLLHAILGEIPKISGTVHVNGSLAYVSQTSWIQSGTVRGNILYGEPMDQTRYEMVIKACALDKDIDSFNHGDLTEIGQRGLNMSGGQKQRIQLARAVYSDADIYLLDDPFSAVDAHTAATLFNDCVMSALETKTVILVTHQVEFLSEVDRILIMDGGRIIQSGNYEELPMTGTAFEQLVNAHKDAITELGQSNFASQNELSNGVIDQLEESIGISTAKGNGEDEISVNGLKGVQLTEEEEKGIGDAGWKPFFDYIFVPKTLFLLCVGTLAQSSFVALQALSNYWLAIAVEIPKISSAILIGVYAATSTMSAIFIYLRSFLTARLGLKASKAFFSGFNHSIFKAPMLFIDSTPVGRILTRASSDFSVLDFDLPFSISFVFSAGIELLVAIGIMTSVTWQVLIVAIFAMVASKYIQGYYQASARELIRINGTTKAPIMNYASETSLGVVTIRAFNSMERFFQNFLKLVDTDAKLFFYSNAVMEWLILRIETLQNLTLFTAAILLVLLPKGILAPGFVGLSLSYALAITSTQVFVTRWYSYSTNYIISVERIKQFMHIEPEPPAIVEDKRPPSSWPSKGRIELKDLNIRYQLNAPLILKWITCTFKEGKRVGVVGRTGSGKSTLISALFRLVEPESGQILIDGLDICSIGLKDLRMKLSIIPQEPTLFRGSVRTNLDPLGLYSDDEIWKALEKCQLKSTISSLPNLLDSAVSDEGENWSAGQRQLFCLGRVLLKRNRILVLDEATASIDSATDAILQKIIREEFSECTIIAVAHRVPTVIDSDMVMVLSYGKLVEYDEPSKLMQANSSFSKLVGEYWASCRRNS